MGGQEVVSAEGGQQAPGGARGVRGEHHAPTMWPVPEVRCLPPHIGFAKLLAHSSQWSRCEQAAFRAPALSSLPSPLRHLPCRCWRFASKGTASTWTRGGALGVRERGGGAAGGEPHALTGPCVRGANPALCSTSHCDTAAAADPTRSR